MTACSVAPFAMTPDELGDAWIDGHVRLPLRVTVNGQWFGHPHGREMAYGFHELIAHAARTRDLVAGGKPETAFLRFGDRVRMEVLGGPFGTIDQQVVQA